MRILIVEDDQILSRLVKQRLGAVYVFDSVNSLSKARYFLEQYFFQAIVLDVSLPDGSGLDLLHELRQAAYKIPILLISATPLRVVEIKKFYNLADDFLAKPFTLSELELKIYSLFRTQRIKKQEQSLSMKDISVNQRSLLSKKEFLLLKTLLKNRGRILKRENLAQQVWNNESAINNNTLESHISSLRKKIKEPEIKTIRGLGYCIEKTKKV